MLKITSFIGWMVLVCILSTAQAAPRKQATTKIHPEFYGGFCKDEGLKKPGSNAIQGPFVCFVKDKYAGQEEVAAVFDTVPEIYANGFRIVLIYNNEAMEYNEKKTWISILVERK